jgi:hypothetical protein
MAFRVKVRIEEHSQTQTFIFARGRLCAKARYFAKAFDGHFIEARTGIVVLDDISVEDFRHFGDWISTGRLSILPLDRMVRLYALGDRFDAQDLRIAITDRLALECFRFGAPLPSSSVLQYVAENIPESLPLYHLLANAVARICYHNSSLLESLPTWFVSMVNIVLEKPYGLCDICCDRRAFDDNCTHFFDQPSDHDPRRYREVTDTIRW